MRRIDAHDERPDGEDFPGPFRLEGFKLSIHPSIELLFEVGETLVDPFFEYGESLIDFLFESREAYDREILTSIDTSGGAI